MEILRINKLECDEQFIDSLLKKEIMDDYLFDRVFIQIDIKRNPADIVNWFYRLLWESCYIKMTRHSNEIEQTENELHILITLSEAISFIKSATPPIMQSQISEAMSSVDEIVNNLRFFLCEKHNGEEIHYQDIFRNIIRYKVYETFETYDLERLDKLHYSSSGYTILIMMTVNSMKDTLTYDKDKNMICIIRSNGVNDLNNIVNDIIGQNIYVTNVSIQDKKVHVKVLYNNTNVSHNVLDNLAMSYRDFI